jgi:hypothetical protein
MLADHGAEKTRKGQNVFVEAFDNIVAAHGRPHGLPIDALGGQSPWLALSARPQNDVSSAKLRKPALMAETHVDEGQTDPVAVLCSDCLQDEGLKLDAQKLGFASNAACPNCGSRDGAKLDAERGQFLAYRFFVVGSLHRTQYGGAPIIQFNSYRQTDIDVSGFHGPDALLLSKILGIGFFYYGPPLWAVGEVEPLKALEEAESRAPVIERILAEYPRHILTPNQPFYRLRTGVAAPAEPGQYDSPPDQFCGAGRLDAPGFPVLYGSKDLELCVHECRVTVEDRAHVVTLKATQDLTLLDLTTLLEEDVTSFESLDMAVHMLFLAGKHAYPIARAIASAAAAAGLDGILFPSSFSLLRTGQPFLETAFGLSTRVYPGATEREARKVAANIALFGRPIADGRVSVACINRLYLRQAAYDLGFGPAVT